MGKSIHGCSGTNEYQIWKQMIKRCHNPNDPTYPYYGGRGIIVCSRWRHSFVNFITDMGRRPSLNHSIDRLKGHLSYSPDNCKWSTKKEQVRNRSNSRYIEIGGQLRLLAELADEHGLHTSVLWKRLYHHGWPLEEALNTPVRKRP
jgi:hypothetical protein